MVVFKKSSYYRTLPATTFDDDIVVNNNSVGETSEAAVLASNCMIVENPSYSPWLIEHPCALSSFQEILEIAKTKKIVVFLDYDGTLSPIVSDPNAAFMSDSMRFAVREVAKKFPTAIISGRSREKVANFVRLDEVCYAGSHGMDIFVPLNQSTKSLDGNHKIHMKGKALPYQPAQRFRPEINKMLNELRSHTKKIQGAYVEDNMFCVSVHYRHVKDEDYGSLEEKVKTILLMHKQFHMTRGKKVLEIRPTINWNKGNAVLYLLETLGLDHSDDVLPFYIGDDKTDEDAFKVLKERGKGCPIIVSSTPRETMASYSLRDPSEVLTFLMNLGNLQTREIL